MIKDILAIIGILSIYYFISLLAFNYLIYSKYFKDKKKDIEDYFFIFILGIPIIIISICRFVGIPIRFFREYNKIKQDIDKIKTKLKIK